MKLIIAGSRSITNPAIVYQHIEEVRSLLRSYNDDITEVVSGTAKGVDTIGESWAELNEIDIVQFPAPWKELGKLAGLSRNIEMAEYADGLIAIWDGYSTGTAHMIATIVTMDKPVYWRINGEDETKTTTEPV